MTRSGDSHWPATEIWSVSDERQSLRSISKLRKSEGEYHGQFNQKTKDSVANIASVHENNYFQSHLVTPAFLKRNPVFLSIVGRENEKRALKRKLVFDSPRK